VIARLLQRVSRPFSPYAMTRRTFVACLFLVALLVRLAALFALRNIHKFHGMQGGADPVEFNAIAMHVASGLCYCVSPAHPTAFRAPGWPLFLAGLYSISFENYPLAYLTLCVIGAVTCVVIYLAAAHVLSEGQARVAGVVTTFYFPHIYFSTLFQSEGLFILLLSTFLLLLLKHLKQPGFLKIAGAGLILGYAFLTRPVALLLLPIVGIFLLWHNRRNPLRGLVAATVLGLACAAVIVPWNLRNHHVFHKFVLATTNGGSTFYGANNDIVLHDPHWLGSWVPTPWLPGRDWVLTAPDEVEHDAREYKLGKQWVRDHLVQIPLLEFYKFGRLVLPDMISPNKGFRILQAAGYLPMLVLMIFGWSQCFRRPYRTPQWMAVHCLVLMTLVSVFLYYGSDRFRDATTPALAIYAALGAAVLWRRVNPGEAPLT
jgi:4-amino-4-deoxy-L-arabinose transferase-like glycosyltransferase